MRNKTIIYRVLSTVLVCIFQASISCISAQDNHAADTTRIILSDSIETQPLPNEPFKKWVPNPKRALWLALVIPGGGQIYNRKYWKLPLVYGGFMGCAYALTWNNMMYKDYSQAYLDIMDVDENTKSYEDFLPYNVTITDSNRSRYQEILRKRKDYYRKYRDMSIFAFAAVYLLSVVDAYVDAELSSFEINEDLSLRIEPTVINSSVGHTNDHLLNKANSAYGLQCSLKF